MLLHFHQKTYDILANLPQFSVSNRAYIDRVEWHYGLVLPASVREWYSLRGSEELLQRLTFVHEPTPLTHLLTDVRADTILNEPTQTLHFLIENQGVWHLAVLLNAGEDPPVYLGYDEQEFDGQNTDVFSWHLHAHTFSNCMTAFAWDYDIIAQENGRFVDAETASLELADQTPAWATGPTTFVASACFVASQFYRYERGDERVTYMIDA